MTFLPSLIQVSMMMLGQMRETHTQMEYQCSSLYCSISISATECYNFISKELIDTVILYSQMCKRKCNITALFLRAPNVGTGLNLNGNSIQDKPSILSIASETCFFKNGKCNMKIKILNLHQIVIKRIVKNDGYLLISKNISLYHVIHQMPIKLDPNK